MKFDKSGLDDYLTSKELEQDGVWLRFPGDRRFLVRRAGGSNTRFQRVLQHLMRPHRRQMDRGTLAPEKMIEIMRVAYAKAVVIDWDGIRDDAGQPVPLTEENAIAYFEAFPELFNEIIERAGEVATFSESLIAEAQEALGES